MGFIDAVKKIIFPFLENLGILWVSGTVIAAQEHFVTHLLRQKFIAVSYTHLRAHETVLDLVCRLLLEKKKHKYTHAV